MNKFRQIFDLSDFWDFKFDENDNGLTYNWEDNLTKTVPIAPLASWNDHLQIIENYKGVLTRDRRPKMTAHMLKKLWSKE